MERPEEEVRTVSCFAWLPLRLHDGTWTHLTWLRCEQVWTPDYGGVATGHWLTVRRWHDLAP